MDITIFEKFQNETQEKIKLIQEAINNNAGITKQALEKIQSELGEFTKRFTILESDVRAIGGRNLPKDPVPNPKKEKFAFTIFDLVD